VVDLSCWRKSATRSIRESRFARFAPNYIVRPSGILTKHHAELCRTRTIEKQSGFRQIHAGGGIKRVLFHEGVFDSITTIDNLLAAWHEFRKGKRGKTDLRQFEYTLEDHLFQLQRDLASGTYQHAKYRQFRITDPKERTISKAAIRDRLLHRAIYRILYPKWDTTFIFDSYSCRDNKGTHKAFMRLEDVARKVSKNYTQPCFALKCDIRKFFDSIDHQILIGLLEDRITDGKLLKLLRGIIGSFEHSPGKGMPLGNLTSQLFANIYMDSLDKFVKHQLKAKHYLRYADDFIFLTDNPDELMGYFVEVNHFLETELKLNLHPDKISLRKLNWGIDYVGYVTLPYYSLPRKKTVRRILKNLERAVSRQEPNLENQYQSYSGYLCHVNSSHIQAQLKEIMNRSWNPG
jgi:retron-type reverse transcriptase